MRRIVVLPDPEGPISASFSPGMTFGEMAMLDGGGRTANAEADRPSTVHALTVDAMARIERELSLARMVERYRGLYRQLAFTDSTAAGLHARTDSTD